MIQVTRAERKNSLTVFTRATQWAPESRCLLEDVLTEGFDELADIAVEVAVETGDPIGQVLADVLRAQPDGERAKRLMGVLTNMPEAAALREARIEASGQMLADASSARATPVGEVWAAQLGREHALSLGLAERFVEAVEVLNTVVTNLDILADNTSESDVRMRMVIHQQKVAAHEMRKLLLLRSGVRGDEAVADDRSPAEAALDPPAAYTTYVVTPAEAAAGAGALLTTAETRRQAGDIEGSLRAAQQAVELLRSHVARNSAHPAPPPVRRGPPSAEALAGLLESALQAVAFAQLELWRGKVNVADGDGRKSALVSAVAALEAVELVQKARKADESERALTAAIIAGVMGALGETQRGLNAAEQALSFWQPRADAGDDTYADEKAAEALTLVAGFRSELGDLDTGLSAANEAIGLYRKLASHRPDAFARNLARALMALAHTHYLRGERWDGIDAARQAIRHLKRLPEPVSELADAHMFRGLLFKDAGETEAATRDLRDAMCCWEMLAEAHPLFNVNLAQALVVLATHLQEAQNWPDVVITAERAVSLLRTLVAQRSPGFSLDLAKTLRCLARGLLFVGRRNDAAVAAEESVAIYRKLAGSSTQSQSHLASSLMTLRGVQTEIGRLENSVTAAREACSIYRKLVEDGDTALSAELADALFYLTKDFVGLERYEDALAATLEAVALYRTLASDQGGSSVVDLAHALAMVGASYYQLEQLQQALQAFEESSQILKTLAKNDEAFTHDYLVSLAQIAEVREALSGA